MNKNIKRISVVCLCILLSGCSMFQSALNDIKGNLVGNGYTIYTYDNYGSEVMETSGDKISITGNAVESTSYDENGHVVRGYELSSVITITVDGKEIESCGDTCIFEQEVMGMLVNQGQLMSYMHKGFWQCMDTHREHLELESMWEKCDAPWKVWED